MKRTRPLLVTAVLLIIFLGNSGCIISPKPPEDDSFLDPIPEATLQAFQFGYKIETRLQAVIAARREIEYNGKNYINVPQVVSVEKMNYSRALARLENAISRVGEDQPENLGVWLVVFLCETRPPSATPEQASESSQNCTFVVLNEQDGHAMLMGSSPDCKSLYEW